MTWSRCILIQFSSQTGRISWRVEQSEKRSLICANLMNCLIYIQNTHSAFLLLVSLHRFPTKTTCFSKATFFPHPLLPIFLTHVHCSIRHRLGTFSFEFTTSFFQPPHKICHISADPLLLFPASSIPNGSVLHQFLVLLCCIPWLFIALLHMFDANFCPTSIFWEWTSFSWYSTKITPFLCLWIEMNKYKLSDDFVHFLCF